MYVKLFRSIKCFINLVCGVVENWLKMFWVWSLVQENDKKVSLGHGVPGGMAEVSEEEELQAAEEVGFGFWLVSDDFESN